MIHAEAKELRRTLERQGNRCGGIFPIDRDWYQTILEGPPPE